MTILRRGGMGFGGSAGRVMTVVGSIGSVAASGSNSITLPSAALVGDIIFWCGYKNNATALTSAAVPAGFTSITFNNDADDGIIIAFKRCVGGEQTLTPAVTINCQSAILVRAAAATAAATSRLVASSGSTARSGTITHLVGGPLITFAAWRYQASGVIQAYTMNPLSVLSPIGYRTVAGSTTAMACVRVGVTLQPGDAEDVSVAGSDAGNKNWLLGGYIAIT